MTALPDPWSLLGAALALYAAGFAVVSGWTFWLRRSNRHGRVRAAITTGMLGGVLAGSAYLAIEYADAWDLAGV
jgi:O-antigen/teichoic acid export membrane protein